MIKEYIQCSCHGEGILIEHDAEDDMYYISFMATSPEYFKLGLWSRLKSAWRLLKEGKFYNDQLVISHDEAAKLVRFLSDSGRGKEIIKTYTVDEMYRDAENGMF